jgi:hypothetical protein
MKKLKLGLGKKTFKYVGGPLQPTAAGMDLEALPSKELPEPVIPEALKATLDEGQQAVVVTLMKALRGHIEHSVGIQLTNVVQQVVHSLFQSNPGMLGALTMQLTNEQLKEVIDVEAMAKYANDQIQMTLNTTLHQLDAKVLTDDLRQQVLKQINVQKLRDDLVKHMSKTTDDYMVAVFPRIVVLDATGKEVGSLSLRGAVSAMPISPELKAAASLIGEKPITSEKPITPKSY